MRMPDTRIPLSGGLGGGDDRGGAIGGAMGTLGQMMRIKEQQDVYQHRQQEREQERRELEDDDAIRTTLPKYDRPDEAIDDLYKQGRATAAAKLGTSIYNERKAKAAAYDAQLVSAGKRLTQAGQIAQGITDDSTYQPARKALVDLLQPLYGDGINDLLPTTYDAPKMKSLVAAGTARAQQITAEHNAATEIQTALDKGVDRADKFTKIGSNLLSQATNKAQWDGYVANLYSMGAPKPVIAAFGDWDDADPTAATKRAGKLGLTGKEEADIARTADRDKVLKEQGAERNRIAADRARTAAENAGGSGGGTGGRGSKLTVNALAEMKVTRNKAMAALDEKHRSKAITTDEYLDRKIETQNDYRNAAEDLLPFDAAAKKAVAEGDKTGYDALAEKYKAITGGARELSKLVPWKGAPAASAPAAGRGGAPPTAATLKALKAEFATATPARKAEITKELKALVR